jgi:cell division protein FtsB
MTQVFQNGLGWLHRSRRKLATAAIGALFGLIGYHAVFGANGFLDLRQKETTSHELKREIDALQQENESREKHIKALKSDPQAIEKEARENFNWVREGDKVFKVTKPTPTPANPR